MRRVARLVSRCIRLAPTGAQIPTVVRQAHETGYTTRRAAAQRRPPTRYSGCGIQPQEFDQVVAENRHPVGVAQTWRAEHVIDRGGRPRERCVRSEHDLAGTRPGDKMPQALGGEDERVEIELLQIVAWRVLVGAGAVRGKGEAAVVETAGIRGQEPTAVRGADLQARKPIEGAFEDQVRDRDRRLERVADDIREEPVALDP